MKQCLIMIAMILSGCETYIDTQDVQTMNTICANNGGLRVAIITGISDGYDVYQCNDGAKFDVKSHFVKGMQ